MFGNLIRRFRRMSRTNQIFSAFFVAVAVAFGGAKPVMGYFRFMLGLRDDGSFISGQDVHIEWVKTGEDYIPDDADVYVDARLHGDNDDDHWQLVAQGKVGDYTLDFSMSTDDVYDFNIWYFFRPSPVTTNGVWKYETIMSPSGHGKIVPVRATVTGDGKQLTPGGML